MLWGAALLSVQLVMFRWCCGGEWQWWCLVEVSPFVLRHPVLNPVRFLCVGVWCRSVFGVELWIGGVSCMGG
jgi:hypothetical protein